MRLVTGLFFLVLIILLATCTIIGIPLPLTILISFGIPIILFIIVYVTYGRHESSKGIKRTVGGKIQGEKVMLCPVCNITVEQAEKNCPQCGREI